MKKWLALLVGPLVSIGIIYLLVGDDIEAVRHELTHARYGYLIPCGVLLVAGLVTRAIRWRVLLNQRVSVWHTFHIQNVGYFLSGVLPLRLGDIARAWMTTRLQPPVPAFSAISTIVVERLLDVLALVAMIGMMLALLDVPGEITSAGAIIAVLALIGAGGLAMLSARPGWALGPMTVIERRIPIVRRLRGRARLQSFLDGIQPMSKPSVALAVVAWTGVSWAFSLAAGYVLLFMLFDAPTIAATVSYIVLATMSVALPAVPGNLGPFEGAVVGGLWIGGMIEAASAPENAPAVALGVVLHALTLGIYVMLGLMGLWFEQASLRQVTRGAQTFQAPLRQESVLSGN